MEFTACGIDGVLVLQSIWERIPLFVLFSSMFGLRDTEKLKEEDKEGKETVLEREEERGRGRGKRIDREGERREREREIEIEREGRRQEEREGALFRKMSEPSTPPTLHPLERLLWKSCRVPPKYPWKNSIPNIGFELSQEIFNFLC